MLLLSLTLAGAVTFALALLKLINNLTMTLGGQIEKDLKTGRADLGVWSN